MTTSRCRAKNPESCRVHGNPTTWAEDKAHIRQTLFYSGWSNTSMASIEAVIEDLRAKHGNPIVGRTRAVFTLDEGTVVKIPLNDEGVSASSSEEHAYRRSIEEEMFIPVAACEFKQIGERYYLHMEKVKPLLHVPYKDLPDWVGYVDGGQVGYNREGKLVAYDL